MWIVIVILSVILCGCHSIKTEMYAIRGMGVRREYEMGQAEWVSESVKCVQNKYTGVCACVRMYVWVCVCAQECWCDREIKKMWVVLNMQQHQQENNNQTSAISECINTNSIFFHKMNQRNQNRNKRIFAAVFVRKIICNHTKKLRCKPIRNEKNRTLQGRGGFELLTCSTTFFLCALAI